MIGIADIHCHVLPYVDDGAQQKEESGKLLRMQYKQGVRYICCTPHLRKGMFETPDEDIFEQFERMKARERSLSRRMQFFLSREYYCDDSFIYRVEQKNVLTLGNSNFLLTELSSRYSPRQVFDYIQMIKRSGYRPLIAHMERYPAFLFDMDAVKELVRMGAKVQVNAGSILGREGMRQAAWTRRLIKNKLVYVVASDAHDTDIRKPELDKAAAYLERRYGQDYALRLLRQNPLKILIPGRERNGTSRI